MRLNHKNSKKTAARNRTSIKACRDAHGHKRLVRAMMILSGCALLTNFAAPALGQAQYDDLKLLPSNGSVGAYFGSAVGIDNGVIAVGSYLDNTHGFHAGSAYLFNASTGAQLMELIPDDGRLNPTEFGGAIAIDDGIVAVGGYHSPVHLFDVSTGDQLFVLGGGYSIDIDDGIVATALPWDNNSAGTAYLYDVNTGAQLHILTPNDGESHDLFGLSIAIDNGIVAVGADYGAYLFDAATGEQLFKLLPGDADAYWFGHSIALDNGVVAVGAPRDYDNGPNSGSVFLFDVATGTQFAKLLASDGATSDLFGLSIALENGVVAVGAVSNDDNNGSGSVYLFDVTTGAEITKLLPGDGTSADLFGQSIAVDDGVYVVGAIRDDVAAHDSGSAYVFGIYCPGTADVNHDGNITPADFSAWIAAFNAMAPECDQNGDGSCTPADFTAWIANFNAGC